MCTRTAGIKRGPAQGKKTDVVTPSFVSLFCSFSLSPLSVSLSPQWHGDGWQTAGVKVEECVINSQASLHFPACVCVCVFVGVCMCEVFLQVRLCTEAGSVWHKKPVMMK